MGAYRYRAGLPNRNPNPNPSPNPNPNPSPSPSPSQARVASLTGGAVITSGVLSLTQAGTSARRGALLLRAWGRYPALRTLNVQVIA